MLQIFDSFKILSFGKELNLSNLKALSDDRIDVAQKKNFCSLTMENIVGKWEYAGYQFFLLFQQCF